MKNINRDGKYILFAIFGFMILGSIILSILTFSFSSKSKTPAGIPSLGSITPTISQTPSSQQPLDHIIPSKSTKKDVLDTLGDPSEIGSEDGYITYAYRISGTARENKVYLQDNTVQYITEEVTTDNSLYTDYITKNNKQEDGVLYDHEHDVGFDWYIFAHDGIAMLTNKTRGGYVIRIQHFAPTDYQIYLNTVAKDFSLSQTPDENVEQFH